MKKLLTNSRKYSLSFSLFFLIAFLVTPIFSFAQGIQNQKDAPRFVYPTSISLAYGLGKNYTGFDTLPNGSISVEIQQIIAYQFNNYFLTGIGAGLDFWIYDKKISTFIPIFAHATVKLMDKKTSPIVFTNLGYAFKWQSEKKLEENVFYGTTAGIYFQAGMGLNVKFSDRVSLLFSAYYKMQQSTIQYRESDLLLAYTNNQLFHFVGIKIGVLY